MESPYGDVLKCRPLENIAPHMFTTRQLQLSSADDWLHVASLVGARKVATLNQVHGSEVVTIRRGPVCGDTRREADGLVSDDPETAIAVRAADCVPLLIADSKTNAVAAVHAGWRGTAAGITTAAVRALSREFGAHPERMVAAIGPCIGPCCYEVGSELVDAFAAAGHGRQLIDRWFLARDSGVGIRDPRLQPLYLDLPGANRDQLVLAGVPNESIHAAGLCTAMHLDVLTSFRAEKQDADRIAGMIRCRS
jgi:hypothetical protein